MSLIDKLFNIRKNDSMDAYLADIKEAVDQMEEVEVGFPKKVIVYYTLKNLPSDYDMVKQVILHEGKLPTYIELEARLLNEEMNRCNSTHEEPEALATSHYGFSRRSHTRWPQNQGNRTSSSSWPYGGLSVIYS